MKLSGWCSGPNGCDSQRAHGTCADRMKRGLLVCECPERGGHQTNEKAAS